MDYVYRPGLKGKGKWWPYPPPPMGGSTPWVPSEAEVKWLATGKGLRGRKTTDKHALCVGGPWHGCKVRRRWYLTKKTKWLMATMPAVFTCPPYYGRYQWDLSTERYQWLD